jgi:methyltransferase (TIGR00027 family)
VHFAIVCGKLAAFGAGELKESQASDTAQRVAFARALETMRPEAERAFSDPWAKHFLSVKNRVFVELSRLRGMREGIVREADRKFPGVIGEFVHRTRFIDEASLQAIGAGIRQVVIVGAGFDTRALRLPAWKDAQVFEVDHPATQERKRAILARAARGGIPRNLHYAPIDLTRNDLSALTGHGFDPTRPTFWIVEGLIFYLTRKDVDRLFADIVRHSPAGGTSRVVFNYLNSEYLAKKNDPSEVGEIFSTVDAIGESFQFALSPDEVAGYVRSTGLELLEQASVPEYAPRFLRNGQTSLYRLSGMLRLALAKRP